MHKLKDWDFTVLLHAWACFPLVLISHKLLVFPHRQDTETRRNLLNQRGGLITGELWHTEKQKCIYRWITTSYLICLGLIQWLLWKNKRMDRTFVSTRRTRNCTHGSCSWERRVGTAFHCSARLYHCGRVQNPKLVSYSDCGHTEKSHTLLEWTK